MRSGEDTHLILEVTIDQFDAQVSYKGYDAWINARKAALDIGRSGFFHREDGTKLEAKFYPAHRINLVTIRPAYEE